MKLSTILSNYDEFQSSYKKIGYPQDTININNKRQFRQLLERVLSDIVSFNDLLNIYDYDRNEKKQILSWLNKLGYKRETFIQILIDKNIDNYYEDENITEDDYTDLYLFESINIIDEIDDMTFITEDENIEDEIDEMEFITEDDFDIVNEIDDMTFLMESKNTNDTAEKKKKGFIVDLPKFNKFIDNYIEETNFADDFSDFEFSESDFFKDTNVDRPKFIDKDYDYLDDICQTLNDEWLGMGELSSEILTNPKSYKKLGELIGQIFMSNITPDQYDESDKNSVDITTHLDFITNLAGEYYAKEIIKTKWFSNIDES